jgi:glycosyltransferase involved in cell wall biosynthesis
MRLLFPYLARWNALNWSRYHSLLTALADEGHVVHVLQPPPLASAETNFRDIEPVSHPRLLLHDIRLNGMLWNTRWPLDKLVKKAYYALVAYETAKRLVRDGEIDVVLLYNIPHYRFMRLRPAKIVFDYADDYIDMLSHELGRWNSRLLRDLARRILHRMMRDADVTFAVSHVLAAQAVGRVHVLPNGVSLPKAERWPTTAIQPIHNRSRPVVGFVGSFEYFVDLKLTVEAAKALPEVHFLLVGTGREWNAIRDAVRDGHLENVQLTGGVPHDQVFEYIRHMDVCLNLFRKIPVSERACPIKIFEYMSQRKPVITTRLAELRHIDDDFLYYADTLEELVGQIRRCLADQGAVGLRAERAYLRVVERHTWESIAASFVRLVEASELLGGGEVA